MERFSPSLAELRVLVDEQLDAHLQERERSLPESGPMIRELARLVSAGGKRLRPSFCYWGFRAGGGRHSAAAVSAAASLELLHTFAIVHDDIMDSSDERRGEETVHVRHGVDVAILVGDLALVLADDLFLSAGLEPERALAAFRSYSLMRQEVIAGQYLDVMASHSPGVEEAHARRIAVLKSGRYSIEKPLVIGALLAGAQDEIVAGLSRFGDPLGEAFQLRDDLLGSFGDRSSMGKPVDSDIREGKRHVLFARALAGLEGDDRDFLRSRWGGGESLSEAEVERLRGLLDSSGARAHTEGLLDGLWAAALENLAGLSVPSDSKSALEELGRQATARAV